MRLIRASFLFGLTLWAGAAVAGQSGGTPPTATLKFAKSSAAPGAVVDATLTVTFAPGLHGYQNPPADEYQIPVDVKVVESGFSLVKATYPKGADMTMAGEKKPTKVYAGTITIPVKVKASAKPGTYNVNVRISYQECNESSCFAPSSLIAKAMLTVAKKP
jgi:DsbC/DsbD-like thiol-disulfide interchange protein